MGNKNQSPALSAVFLFLSLSLLRHPRPKIEDNFLAMYLPSKEQGNCEDPFQESLLFSEDIILREI